MPATFKVIYKRISGAELCKFFDLDSDLTKIEKIYIKRK